MNKELNTLLITLYVFITDNVIPAYDPPVRRGRKQQLTDAELLCLAVAQHLTHGESSESKWVRYAQEHLRDMFPYIPQQSGYNKRIRAAFGLIQTTVVALTKDTDTWHEVLRLLDATPIPCGRSRQTAQRSGLAGHAGYGFTAAHREYFWGMRLVLISTPDGMPVIWGLGNPKLGERAITQTLLDGSRHLLHPGQAILGDKGFSGKAFEAFITHDLHATLLRPDRKDETPRFGNFGGVRQWIESIFDTLKGQLGLEHHGARTLQGLLAKIGAKLLAMAAGIWHNWKTGTPHKRSLIAYDH